MLNAFSFYIGWLPVNSSISFTLFKSCCYVGPCNILCCDSYHSNVPFQASLGKDQNGLNEVMSLQEAEDLKLKEKRRREREVHFPSNLNLMVMLIVHVSTLIGGCVAYDACFGF